MNFCFLPSAGCASGTWPRSGRTDPQQHCTRAHPEPGLSTPWGQTPPGGHHPLMRMRMVRTFPGCCLGLQSSQCSLTVRVPASAHAEAANPWASQGSRGVCRSAVAAAVCPWSLPTCTLLLGSFCLPSQQL